MSYSGNFVDKSRIENNLGSCSIDGFGNTLISGNNIIVGDLSVGAGDITYGFNQDATLKISPVVGSDLNGKKLTISGGQGTGAGLGGDLELQTAESGVAGSNTNPLTTKMIIKQDGKVGISDTAPISELSVAGRLALTAEQGTPTAPTDGNGWIYTKGGGDIYWQSFDIPEVSLTTKYREIFYYENNQGATETNKMFIHGDPGFLYDYTAKNNGTITNMVLNIDDSDGFYSSWTGGTLTFRIDVNTTTVYTSTSYTPALYASAVTSSGRELSNYVAMVNLDTLSISYNKNDFISVHVSSSGLNSPSAGNMEIIVNLAMEER